MSQEKQKFISLGGLWVKEGRDGVKFLVGNIGFNGKILIFRNMDKKSDNSPDYFLYLAPSEDKDKPKADDDNKQDIPF